MRENLHRFFRAARGAGVRLSPAESIDAMRAVSQVGFADRDILRDTFLLTLANTQDQQRAVGHCFVLFCSHPEPPRSPENDNPETSDKADQGEQTAGEAAGGAGGQPTEGLGSLAQTALSHG